MSYRCWKIKRVIR